MKVLLTMKLWSNFLLVFLLIGCSENSIKRDDNWENSYPSSSEKWEEAVDEKEYTAHQTIEYYFENKQSDQQVLILAEVQKVLSDDTEGSQHQRFILTLDNDQTLLVAHNIDLAPRVVDIQKGDQIEVFGVYEWNNKGGVIHWTHHDPDGDHIDGYILHNDKIYQ